MAVTSGFFNSLNSDRRYNALQMAELFDGLINDGVYETLYNKFRVTPNSNGLAVQVDTGRAWFDHTWIKNDGIYVLTLPPAEVLFDRIDAVVIEVNHTQAVRQSTIKIVKGTPSANPARPTLSHSNNIFQHPLAYVRVKVGATAITQANITNMVGTSSCPFVTGVVSVMNIDMLVEQWAAQWDEWVDKESTDVKNWLDKEQNDFLTWFGNKKRAIILDWDTWFHQMQDMTGTNLIDWIDRNQNDFLDWFNMLRVMLDGDVATNLAKEIADLKIVIKTLALDGVIYYPIEDSDGNPILDDDGHQIETAFSIYTSAKWAKEHAILDSEA